MEENKLHDGAFCCERFFGHLYLMVNGLWILYFADKLIYIIYIIYIIPVISIIYVEVDDEQDMRQSQPK